MYNNISTYSDLQWQVTLVLTTKLLQQSQVLTLYVHTTLQLVVQSHQVAPCFQGICEHSSKSKADNLKAD